MDQTAQFSVFIAVAVAIVFVFVWLGVQTAFGIRYSRLTDDGGPVDKKAIAVWVLSIAGGFTGPFCVLTSIGSIVGALVILKRKPDANERTRAAAHGAIGGASTLLVMIASMMLVMALGGVFG